MRPFESEWNSVVILDALSTGERQTGEILASSIEAAVGDSGRPGEIKVWHRPLGTKRQLQHELSELARACARRRPYTVRPILHLEMHGHAEGVWLGENCEYAEWTDLLAGLVAVNKACRGQLQVTMGACFGAYIVQLINPPSPAPFWGALGPIGSVMNLTVEGFFTEYFVSLLETQDAGVAIERARATFSDGASAFQYCSGREIFVSAHSRAVQSVIDPHQLNELVTLSLQGKDPRDPVAHLDIGRRLRAKAKAQSVVEASFRQEREAFFMTGYRSDGTHRSGVEWEDLLEEAMSSDGAA